MNSRKPVVALILGIFGLLFSGPAEVYLAMSAAGASDVASQYRNAPMCADQVSATCRANVPGMLVRYSYDVYYTRGRAGSKDEHRNYYLDLSANNRDYQMQIDKATFDGKSLRTGQSAELEIWQDRVTMVRQIVPSKRTTLATAFPNQTVSPAVASAPDFNTTGVNAVEALDSPARTAQNQHTGAVIFGIIAVASAGAIIYALITLRRSHESRTATE